MHRWVRALVVAGGVGLLAQACGGELRDRAGAGRDGDAGVDDPSGDASAIAVDAGESPSGYDGGPADGGAAASGDGATNAWFFPYTTVDVPSLFSATSVGLGDVNGDGAIDAVVGGVYWVDGSVPTIDSALFVFAGDGHGGFAPPILDVLQSGNWSPTSLAVFDATGDGRADVVFPYGTDLAVVPQTATGALGDLARYSLLPPGYVNYYVDAIAIADVDGDGTAEIVATASDGVVVVERDGAGGLRVRARIAFGGGGTKVGDVNGDGLPDLVGFDDVHPRSFSSQVVVRAQLADGGFATEEREDIDPMNDINAVAIGDTDGDGKSDVAMTLGGNRPDSKIAVLTQRAGTLTGLRSLPSLDIPATIHVVDVDGDHRNDLVVLHEDWAAIGVYLQQSNGAIAPEQSVPFADVQSTELAEADIDGDGNVDFVAATAGQLAVLRHLP